MSRQPYGWAGRVNEFLSAHPAQVQSALERHLSDLLGMAASESQRGAWEEEQSLLRASLRDLAIARPDVLNWGLALEYELLLEGGRRPDVILHAGSKLLVLEYKQAAVVPAGAIDQVNAYGRDLAEYHLRSHNLPVETAVVTTRSSRPIGTKGGAHTVGPSQVAALLDSLVQETTHVEFDEWLSSPYEPLPTLVEAARMIFNEEPLPRIRRAESAGIPEALNVLVSLSKEAKRDSRRSLTFLAGVPGAGKTLAGLQFVYDQLAESSDAVFLSGNGPLVDVLRDALKSKAFVQDLHAFITTYGTSDRPPSHHVIVFDEAQRAWDRNFMNYKGRGTRSEPEVLISVSERLEAWCALVGLVGDGQEIHSGEEAGMAQWPEALSSQATTDWFVAGPPRLSETFADFEYRDHDELDLTVSLRSRRADDLHSWVAALLEGRVRDAARKAEAIKEAEFSMYVTRSLPEAKRYIIDRYTDDPQRRVGILASSRTQRFLPQFGVASDWPSTKKVNFAYWYNRDRGEPRAGGNLEEVVTEFGCQGLELDMPLVAWGDDVRWVSGAWSVKPGRPRYPQDDPHQLRLNCYRVLLTRGRDGFVIFVPPDPLMDETEHVLLASGVTSLHMP